MMHTQSYTHKITIIQIQDNNHVHTSSQSYTYKNTNIHMQDHDITCTNIQLLCLQNVGSKQIFDPKTSGIRKNLGPENY